MSFGMASTNRPDGQTGMWSRLAWALGRACSELRVRRRDGAGKHGALVKNEVQVNNTCDSWQSNAAHEERDRVIRRRSLRSERHPNRASAINIASTCINVHQGEPNGGHCCGIGVFIVHSVSIACHSQFQCNLFVIYCSICASVLVKTGHWACGIDR